MKVRVYHDTRKKFRNYVDAWSIVLLNPRKPYVYDDRGCFLGCSPTHDGKGINKCTWEQIEWHQSIGREIYLGKRIALEDCPEGIRNFALKAEKVFNAFIKNPDDNDARYAWEML